MPLKFLTCDVLVDRHSKQVFLTELCPALSCVKGPQVLLAYLIAFKTSSPLGFSVLQAPQEPAPHPNFLSHFIRDGENSFANFLSPFVKPGETPFQMCTEKIRKDQVRAYLHKVFLRKNSEAIWVMYFRTDDDDDTAERFSLLLKRTLKNLKVEAEVLDTYPLAFACERNKVLFWQLLKLNNSALVILKEIFRFTTFETTQQAEKLQRFLTSVTEDRVILKPTNSTLTQGALVIPKAKVLAVINFVITWRKQGFSVPNPLLLPAIIRAEILTQPQQELITLLYPEWKTMPASVQRFVAIHAGKFIYYWLSVDTSCVLKSDRDFFLVEAYKTPSVEKIPEVGVSVSVASRSYSQIISVDKPALNTILVSAKRGYNTDALGEDLNRLIGITFCLTPHTMSFCEANPGLTTDYFLRNPQYTQQVNEALQKPSEQAWQHELSHTNFSDFLTRVKTANADNLQLMEYLISEAVQSFNTENTKFCWHCFAMKIQVLQCSACKQATYCGVDCQRKDWQAYHAEECKIFKARIIPQSAAIAATA